VGFIILDGIGVVTMEPEEYKGFMITEAPGWMYKANEIVSTAHFKHTFNACTVESLKTSINYALEKREQSNRKLILRNKKQII